MLMYMYAVSIFLLVSCDSLCVIFVGGFDDNAPLESTEVYDSETNQWSYVTPMNSPRGGLCDYDNVYGS